MTKVDIISGFLGAGKTTFIKELISKVYSGEKMVLIENEFGEIGVDSRFMQDAGIEVTEMNSGCICCTLVGDFVRALKQVVDTYHPDRIIIEPSGVGKLSDVAKAVSDMQEDAQIEVDSLITVVDGKKAKMYMKNFGEFFDNQIEYANTIVLSRTQMMDEAKLKECIELLREKNEEAAIVTTEWDKLSGDMIKAALEQGHDLKKEMMELISHMHHEHHDHEHHHHEPRDITTITRSTDTITTSITTIMERTARAAVTITTMKNIITTMNTNTITMRTKCSQAGASRQFIDSAAQNWKIC